MSVELMPGERVDRYRVDGKLGEGGMALVYRVQHAQLGTWHALKILRAGWSPTRDRLLLEGRVQAQLQHPNIVAVTDIVEVRGAPGLVMEYVAGPSLDSVLRETRLTLEQADVIGRAVIAGVAAAHEQGLIHRDLKPANILMAITKNGVVPKVADFGLAKLLDDPDAPAAGQTRTGMAMGTPAFMSPEQIRDAKNVDRRTDVFALGAILYELVCGARAFDHEDVLEIFGAVAAGRYEHPRVHNPDLPQRMVDAIVGALQPKRDQRLSDCDALVSVWTGQGPDSAGSVRLPLTPGDPLLRVLERLSNPAGEKLRAGSIAGEGTPQHTAPPVSSPTRGGDEDALVAPLAQPTLSPKPTSDASRVSLPLNDARPSDVWERRPPRALIAGLGALGVLAVAATAWVVYGPGPGAPPVVETPVQTLPPPELTTLPVTPPAADPPATPEVLPPPEVVATPEMTLKPANDPKPVKAPVAISPQVAPPVIPVLVEAAPVVEPPPKPMSITSVTPTTGTIRVTGDAKSVWLQSSAGNFRAGNLAPGTYKIRVFFDGAEARTVGEVTIAAGETKTLLCQKALSQCSVE